MMKNTFKYISVILFIAAFTSCESEEGFEDITVIQSSTPKELTSDWYVVALWPDDLTPAFGGDYVVVTTSNSADNDRTTMIIDDHRNWMEFRTKIDINPSDLTFTGSDGIELYFDGAITLTSGSVTKGTFTTITGAVVDEIHFEAEFDWFPGTSFVFLGHKRTGFLEDESPHYSN